MSATDRRRKAGPIETVAPVARGQESFHDDSERWPKLPPPPLRRDGRPPTFRPLKVYAFGPSLGRTPINVRTLLIRYERLAPGPIGERIAVVDYDATRDCFYDPVDLDDPLIAMNGGLDPSESDPHFHQQMVYALASDSLHRIEVALGRTIQRRGPSGATPLRILIHPHGGELMNTYPDGERMVFGYFRTTEEATGRTVPGQTVFTCLSADVIVHVTVHMLLDAMRPDLTNGSSMDNGSLVETLADLTPLLFHLGYREAVLDTIQRTAGVIYRTQLDVAGDQGIDTPRIIAELSSNNPLLALSQDFGEAIGQSAGLRTALAPPDPFALSREKEPHARGAIVVAAVFDALFSIYQRRTLDLFRIFHAGGGQLRGNDVPEPLANRLCDEVDRIAGRVLRMCWRAVDYCPAGTIELGDFLRACITADFEYSRDDPWGLRDALMQAFRLRGIQSSTASFFTEDAMRWPEFDSRALVQAGPKELTQAAVKTFVENNRRALGFLAADRLQIYPLECSNLTAPDDTPQTTYFTQVFAGAKSFKGVTLVFGARGTLRYAIPSSKPAKG